MRGFEKWEHFRKKWEQWEQITKGDFNMETDVKNIFKYVYLFYTKYHNSIHNDSDWVTAIAESKELYKRFPDKICQDMIFAVINQLDREGKNKEE